MDPTLPSPPIDPTQPLASPLLTEPTDAARAKAQEAADVKAWFDRIEAARKFDEPAREQYAKDRRYARGDSGFEVDANLIGTNIDILESFLYARDPDIDVRPAPSSEPPTLEAMRDAADDYVAGSPDLQQANQQASAGVLHDTGDPQKAAQAGQQASDALKEHMVQQQFAQLRKRYQRRQRDLKAFADTLEIITSRMWGDARLKTRGVRWVRSALTVGLGVLKASWQERTAPSPECVTAINDLQMKIKRAASLRQDLDEAGGADEDAKRAEYQRELMTLKAQAEQVVQRGFVVDLVPAEDFQVAPGYTIADHLDAPWNSHRIPMRYGDAQAQFELPDEVMKQATRYSAKKPVMTQAVSAMVDTINATEADAYESAATQQPYNCDSSGDFVMLEEIWDADSGSVLTGIQGIKRWVKPAWVPCATTRFFPFFTLCTSEVDGQRHPQSLVSRAAKLVDEYNRIGSAEAEHRRRSLPGILVHGGQVGVEQMNKIDRSVTGEWTVIQTTLPNTDLRTIFFQKPYAPVDPGLYDRRKIVEEIERIFGVQEALSGSINVAKTATEADIQQTGFKARTGGRRDAMESMLGELALYTAEVARAHVSLEDAQAIAGPDAMWPAYQGANDLRQLVEVNIRAGSSGKPDTAAERDAWSQQLPLLQQGITQIGQLRGASPADVADALEELLKITSERSGDRLDIDALLPQAGDQPGPDPNAPPPQSIQESSLMGPQTMAATQVLDQVRQAILSAASAKALIQAAYPAFDPALVQSMVDGVTVAPTLTPAGPLGLPAPGQPTGAPPVASTLPPPGAMPAPAPMQP